MLYWLSVAMAEGVTQEKSEVNEKSDNLECAVCLQPCIHPAQLPCGHIFCFLCVKGIANQSKRCAMCRQEIPRDFIEQPKLLQRTEVQECFDGGYQWFYEGRNGWWQYDPRTCEDLEQAFQSKFDKIEILICGETYVINFTENFQYPKRCPSRKRSIKRECGNNINVKGVAGVNNCWWQYDERTSRELEACYKAGERTCELLIAGFLYVADLDAMLQMRRNDHSRRRRIKRDLQNVPKKGVAGLRSDTDQSQPNNDEQSTEFQRPHSPTEGQSDSLTPTTPTNTPQTPASGRESPRHEDLEATVQRIRSLRLDSIDNNVDTVALSRSDNSNDEEHNQHENFDAIHYNRFQF